MRLRGANEYTRGMQKATVATTEYGTAAARAGAQAKAGAVGIDSMSASSKKGIGALEKMKTVGKNMRSTGKNLSTHLTLPIVAAGAYAVHTAAEFEKSMAQIKVAGNVGGQGMESMEDLAIKMGNETIFSANDSAEAMLELVKTGISPAKIEAGALASTMQLAATESLALGKTAEIVGAAMNTFKIPAKESKMITDALAGGALASSASVEGLALSLSQGGQSAAMYGLSVNETVGALAAFAQNGIQASDAGTSFKTFMMRLNPTQKKQKELMDKLNLSFFDQHGKMVGLVEVSKRLRTALSGYTDEQRGAYLQTLFGSDAQRAANIIFREGPKGLKGYISATEKRGAAEKMANAQMKGMPGAIERMKGSLETAALVVGMAMAPVITDLAELISNLAQGFSELSPEVQTFIIIGFGVVAAIGPVVYVLGALVTAIAAVGTALMFFATNPVGLTIVAIVALAAGFYYLYTNVEWFHEAVDTVVGFIKSNWRTVGPYLLFPLMPFAAIVLAVIGNLDWLKNAFNNTVNFFRRLPGRIMDGIRALPRLVGHMLARMLVFWATLPIKIPIFMVTMGIKVVQAAIGIGPKLFSAAIQIISKFLAGLVTGWNAVMDWVHNLPGTIATAVANLASQFFDIGKTIASEIAKGFYESLPGPLKDTLGAGAEAAEWGANAAGDALGFATGGILGNAGGTTFWEGGLTLVGEQGPEIVNLPRGSEVMNAARTRRETNRAASAGPLRTRGGPTPMKLQSARQNGAYKRTIRHEVPVVVELKVERRKFGEAMAMAMIDEDVNE